MMAPFDDDRRLSALAEYGILDTPPEDVFDNLVRLAAKILDAPISLVTLVAEHRQWFKARVGIDVDSTPREYAFCDHAIRQEAPLVVSDARSDPRFATNPFVTGEPYVRFYCGVPLRTPDGQGLGTLCVLDRQPRVPSAAELGILEDFARQVELELEIRRRLALVQVTLAAVRDEQRSKEMLAAMIVHDLRGPLSLVTILASTIQPADEASREDLAMLLAAAERMRHMLADILDVSLHELGGLRPRRATFSMAALARDVVRRLGRLGPVAVEGSLPVDGLRAHGDPELISRILENLINNAFQHARSAEPVTVAVHPGSRIVVEVRDRGAAIAPDDRVRIFDPMVQGRPAPTHRGHGLGLAFCRLAAAVHGGRIDVEPNAGGVGNCFRFDVPAAE